MRAWEGSDASAKRSSVYLTLHYRHKVTETPRLEAVLLVGVPHYDKFRFAELPGLLLLLGSAKLQHDSTCEPPPH